MSRPLSKVTGWALLIGLSFFLIGPLVNLLLWAFSSRWPYPSLLPEHWSLRWWRFVLQDHSIAHAVWASLSTAPVVTLLSVLLCLPAAYALSRLPVPGGRFWMISLLAINAFPKFGLYIAIATLFFRIGLIGTYWGVILIQLLGTVVFMVWIPKAAFDAVPRELEEAARDCGAKPLAVFLRVTLPIALPSIAIAAILAFLAAFDESQGTLIVGAPNITTMPILMYRLVSSYPQPVSAVFSVLLGLPSLTLLLLVRRSLLSGRLAAGFGV
jgi:putative spermidine/putrescine transport system permease protein